MKPQIALSIEQMHELQSLGLDCSDASMTWIHLGHTYNNILILSTLTNEIMQWHDGASYQSPAYTLEDILMKLPSTLEAERTEYSDIFYYDLEIFSHWRSSLWCIAYKGCSDNLRSFTAKNIMKCAFEMLKWVLKNHPDKIKKL